MLWYDVGRENLDVAFPVLFFFSPSLFFLLSSVWWEGEKSGTLSLKENWWGLSHAFSLLLPLTIRLLILLGYNKIKWCALRVQFIHSENSQSKGSSSCIPLLSFYFYAAWSFLKKCLSYMGFQITISLASAVRISKADLAASWQGDQCERRWPLAMVFNLSLGNTACSGNAWSLETWEKDLICSASYFYFKSLSLSLLSPFFFSLMKVFQGFSVSENRGGWGFFTFPVSF